MNNVTFASLDEVREELSKMSGQDIVPMKEWPVYEILAHCAQTIEYSMTGYPQMKPKAIRNTIGRVAIRKFLKQGYMKHSLTAHVPGAPKPELQGTAREGMDLLLRTIEAFQAFHGPLQPHLLFGELSKEQYDQYFAMHIADHFSGLQHTD
ncbi:DUF1569 domain-containing protein [Paenibacillus camerounensis]|uniref:DUF1569 domain-containing protein n=1 Tax=Paenibacillus camerounensis TaxID=1243663 RepID=UPI0006949B37|nr:DUF1569 domain-containing protein [Paenibacillus camerounensis]